MKQIAWMGAALLAAAANTAWADQLADIRAKGEVVIGVLGTAEPYSFIDPKTRELVGYEVDLGKELAKALGVKPVFKQLAVAARIPELQQGHAQHQQGQRHTQHVVAQTQLHLVHGLELQRQPCAL